MKKALFFTESLDGGGAEGALLNLISSLDKSYFDITVYSETNEELRTEEIKKVASYHSFVKKSSSPIKNLINRVILKCSVSLNPSIVKKMYIRGRYDLEVASCEGFATKLISYSDNKNSIKIAFIHTDFVNNHWSLEAYSDAEEERNCYARLDYIVCVSETVKEAFIKTYGFKEKTVVLRNILNEERILEMSKENCHLPTKKPAFILVGNFLKVKGYVRFLEVVKKLYDEKFDFSVTIMGHFYDEYPNVKSFIEQNGLQSVVTLIDYQSNPFKYMKNADCYVCASYAEGYSTAVCEAIICGLPIVTTNCSGMNEIFGGHDIGIICDNSEEGLYDAIKFVLENPEKLEDFERNVKTRTTYFSQNELSKQVNAFLKGLFESER